MKYDLGILNDVSYPLESDSDLDILINEIGDSNAVLIGDATHGTKEFYDWRAKISKRLIEEAKFNFVAVEGDWPDCYRLNRYVKGWNEMHPNALYLLSHFNRWPTWMWANTEVLEFVEWLKKFNDELSSFLKVGFYGLDVYSLWESLRTTIGYLDKNDLAAAKIARNVYKCFEPYRGDIQGYAWSTAFMNESCEREVVNILAHMQHQEIEPAEDKNEDILEEKFNAKQNAFTLADAERYYRTMLRGGSESWNLRDIHMADSFMRIMEFYGGMSQEPKGIIWAHNTHVGDAKATDMVRNGEVNIGQLLRERLGSENVFLIGTGAYKGKVIASNAWEGSVSEIVLPEAIENSLEDIFNDNFRDNTLILNTQTNGNFGYLENYVGHRAVGVVYNPDVEFHNYVPTKFRDRYDAFLYFKETGPVHPIHVIEGKELEPLETYPVGE